MTLKKLKSLLDAYDLHGEKGRKIGIYVGFVLLFLLSIVVRRSLIRFQNGDYTIFSGWYDFAKAHGIHSFKYTASQGFTNYNPPYAYFLYLSTLLPVSKIVAIKGTMAFFDVILAASVYLVVRIFRPQNYVPLLAALLTMFLPTVLFTGVLWGQFDQFYIAFILFSLWAALTGKSVWAWVFFGVAISIKFQAVFFLPALGILSFKKIHWYDLIWGIGSFLVLTLPPILVGRSLGSLISIYPDQAKLFNGTLTLNAPNMYQWFPNTAAFPYLNKMGIYLTIALVVMVAMVTLIYRKFSNRELMVVTALMLFLIPFTLPSMHERYFFPAGIVMMVLALVYSNLTYVGLAVLAQVVTLLSYCPFLFNTTVAPMSILAFGNLVIIFVLGADFFGLLPAAPNGRAIEVDLEIASPSRSSKRRGAQAALK